MSSASHRCFQQLASRWSFLPTMALTFYFSVGSPMNASAQEQEILHPPALKPGDTIAFVAPASPMSRERIMRAKQRLEAKGFVVRAPESLFRRDGFLAGSDIVRAQELMDAFADPEVDAIVAARGGYGTPRILNLLDYDTIKRNPKILAGYSDITALHIAVHQRTGLITFHSPNADSGLGSQRGPTKLADRLFWRALLASDYKVAPQGAKHDGGYAIGAEESDGEVATPTTMSPGVARGRLVGGNLSMVHALMGTPFEIETGGKILFLEDVGEAPYRVDRMLQTLKLGGKLEDVAGVVLGAFTRRDEEDTSDEETTIDDVLRRFFADSGVPVLANFPIGHQPDNATLPIGAMATLDATNKRLVLNENPVLVDTKTD